MKTLVLPVENPIVLSYEVDPEMVCGGVWVEDEKRFVPVAPARNTDGDIDVYCDEEFGHSLIDYVQAGPDGAPVLDGNDEPIVRANLLHVPAGRRTPSWEIKDSAIGYDERHQTVQGDGILTHWMLGQAEVLERHDIALPRVPGEETHVLPGDVFNVTAGEFGIHALAVFSNKPFQLSYEQRVPDPF